VATVAGADLKWESLNLGKCPSYTIQKSPADLSKQFHKAPLCFAFFERTETVLSSRVIVGHGKPKTTVPLSVPAQRGHPVQTAWIFVGQGGRANDRPGPAFYDRAGSQTQTPSPSGVVFRLPPQSKMRRAASA